MTLALLDAPATKVLEYRDNAADTGKPPAPGKPYLVPVQEENAAYDPVAQIRTGPQVIIETTRVRWVYTVRPKSTDEVNLMRQGKIDDVHEEATKRLTFKSGAAASQQIMALTRLMQTIYKYTDRTTWSAADKNIVTQAINRLQLIESMRDTEDTKVTELQALVDPIPINNYNPTTGWPTS